MNGSGVNNVIRPFGFYPDGLFSIDPADLNGINPSVVHIHNTGPVIAGLAVMGYQQHTAALGDILF